MRQASGKHHFIPAFYLKQWADDSGYLIEWSKPYRKVVPQRRHANATGYQLDLYSFSGLPPVIRSWFEDIFLKKADQLAADVLHKMLSGVVHTLSPEERSSWSRFMLSLILRHPDTMAEFREAIPKLLQQHIMQARPDYNSLRKSDDPETFEEMLNLLTEEDRERMHVRLIQGAMDHICIGTRLNALVWLVYQLPPTRYSFVTSDWPVVFSLHHDRPHVVMPLSPRHLFIGTSQEDVALGFLRCEPERLIIDVNCRSVHRARRYVFSHDEEQSTLVRFRMSVDKKASPILGNLDRLVRDSGPPIFP